MNSYGGWKGETWWSAHEIFFLLSIINSHPDIGSLIYPTAIFRVDQGDFRGLSDYFFESEAKAGAAAGIPDAVAKHDAVSIASIIFTCLPNLVRLSLAQRDIVTIVHLSGTIRLPVPLFRTSSSKFSYFARTLRPYACYASQRARVRVLIDNGASAASPGLRHCRNRCFRVIFVLMRATPARSRCWDALFARLTPNASVEGVECVHISSASVSLLPLARFHVLDSCPF